MKIKTMPVAKLSRPDEGLVRGEGVHEKQVERRRGDDRLDPDLAGPKPVELFAAIEQDLHCADGQTQAPEAEPVQLRVGISVGVRQESADADESKRSDRQVDIENPAPSIILGEPATED